MKSNVQKLKTTFTAALVVGAFSFNAIGQEADTSGTINQKLEAKLENINLGDVTFNLANISLSDSDVDVTVEDEIELENVDITDGTFSALNICADSFSGEMNRTSNLSIDGLTGTGVDISIGNINAGAECREQ